MVVRWCVMFPDFVKICILSHQYYCTVDFFKFYFEFQIITNVTETCSCRLCEREMQ